MKTSLHNWMPVVSGSDPPLQEKPVRGSFSCPSQSSPGWRRQKNKRWVYTGNKYAWLSAQEQHTTRKPDILETVILKLGTFCLHIQLCAALHDLNIECFSSDLPIHVSEHEIQKETFPLSEGTGDRHDHHILISNLRPQENSTERFCVQVKGVILLVDCHDLNWPRIAPHPLSYITRLLCATIKRFQLLGCNKIRSHSYSSACHN